MVFPSVCVCVRAGETCGGVRATLLPSVLSMLSGSSSSSRSNQNQQQRNGAVSILVSRTQLHHRADRDLPCVYNEI